jgi:hypothetical protein
MVPSRALRKIILMVLPRKLKSLLRSPTVSMYR